MNFKQLNGVTILESFAEFHRKNPEVYAEFERQALRAIKIKSQNQRPGKKIKLSSKAIINFIRWELSLTTRNGGDFKINDAYTAWYARLFITRNPQYKGVFELRTLRSNINPYQSFAKQST